MWIPMLDGDELPAAQDASARFAGAPQFWDGQQRLGKAIAASLGAPDWTAWDVYLFYPPDAAWTDAGPPAPEAAIAQVAGVVIGTPGALPAAPDQSRLPARLRGKAVVVGEQRDLATLLARLAHDVAARHRA